MSKLNWSMSDKPKTISVFWGSNKKIIQEDNSRFNEILQALRDKLPDDKIISLVDLATAIATNSAGLFSVQGEDVYIGDEKVPYAIAKKIILFTENQLDVKPLVDFWKHLSENPSFNSRDQLFKYIEVNNVPLVHDDIREFKYRNGDTVTVDCSGFFVAWKSVRDNFTDHHTGTFDNTPGGMVFMSRKNVNDNPNETCSDGLHVATWEYAKDFGTGPKRFIKVYVNPQDVVSVPTDYNGTKMRVCKYYVVEEIDRPDSIPDEERKLVHSGTPVHSYDLRTGERSDDQEEDDQEEDDQEEDDWDDEDEEDDEFSGDDSDGFSGDDDYRD